MVAADHAADQPPIELLRPPGAPRADRDGGDGVQQTAETLVVTKVLETTNHLPVSSPPPTPRKISQPRYTLPAVGNERPLTWVLAGDSRLGGSASSDQIGPLVQLLARKIRQRVARQRDRIIDLLLPDCTVTKCRTICQQRILPQQPDVVVLLLGGADARAGMAGFERYEDDLTALIQLCQSAGTCLVINTPPWIPAADELIETDQLIYLEAARAAAKIFEVPLIDHWEHWEAARLEGIPVSCWSDAETGLPNEHGHARMAEQLAASLGLDVHELEIPSSAVAASPAESEALETDIGDNTVRSESLRSATISPTGL